MEACNRPARPAKSKASDIPMRVRRRQSDARWRANVASCFETLKNIIPVNKRASKRQISKAYILQETSKHITFLEGILCTLMQEKANIDGSSEDGAYAAGFEQVKQDFIIDQRDKLAALNNERKYKRNKYKIYISDHLPYGPNDPGAGTSQGQDTKKDTTVGPQEGRSCCHPCPSAFYSQGESGQSPVKRPRIKTIKQQPNVRVIVRSPKRLNVEQPPLQNCQIKKIPITKIKSTVPHSFSKQVPSSTISAPPRHTSPITPSRRKQKVPHKRPTSTKARKDVKKKKPKLSMTVIHPVCTGYVGEVLDKSPTLITAPFTQYHLQGFPRDTGDHGPAATQTQSYVLPTGELPLPNIEYLEEGLEEQLMGHLEKGLEEQLIGHLEKGLDEQLMGHLEEGTDEQLIGHLEEGLDEQFMRHLEKGLEEQKGLELMGHMEKGLEVQLMGHLEDGLGEGQHARYQDQGMFDAQQNVTEDIHTEQEQPLDLTPAKRDPSCTDPHSTPKQPNRGHNLPLLMLSPLQEENPIGDRSIECTPVKTERPDEEKKAFTPVALPKDWMTTPIGGSPGTPQDMSTPALQISYEQRRLDCDEDISSDEEVTNNVAKSPLVQSQAFYHRSSKLQGSRQCPDSGPCEKRKKAVSKRHENMKCRRSLNMSLDIEESHNTADSTVNDMTESCIQDFDRYYQKLRESKSEEPCAEDSVKMDPVWELLKDPASPGLSGNKDEGYQVPEEYCFAEHLDMNATDEYLPLEEYEALGCTPVNDVWQVVPKSERGMWSDGLDIQLVPTDPAGNMMKTVHEPRIQEGGEQMSAPNTENQLVPEYGYDEEEGFHTADVLAFIREQLLSQGIEVPEFLTMSGDDGTGGSDNLTHTPRDKNIFEEGEHFDGLSEVDGGLQRCFDGMPP